MKLLILLTTALSLAACSGGSEPLAPADAAPLASDADPAAVHPATSDLVAVSSQHTVTVYKSPACGCCLKWADHLREHGFTVETVDVQDLSAVKRRYGIPPTLQSCHTAVVDGYIVEGHVPAGDLRRLLAERPDAAGLAVPGMPIGSPGMEQGDTAEPYDVLLVHDGETTVFASH